MCSSSGGNGQEREGAMSEPEAKETYQKMYGTKVLDTDGTMDGRLA